MIKRTAKGYYVQARNGKNMGGPYTSIFEAEERERQVEFWTRRREKQCSHRHKHPK